MIQNGSHGSSGRTYIEQHIKNARHYLISNSNSTPSCFIHFTQKHKMHRKSIATLISIRSTPSKTKNWPKTSQEGSDSSYLDRLVDTCSQGLGQEWPQGSVEGEEMATHIDIGYLARCAVQTQRITANQVGSINTIDEEWRKWILVQRRCSTRVFMSWDITKYVVVSHRFAISKLARNCC